MFDFFVIITRRERNMKNRIDKEMYERLLVPSRSKAQELINLGVVFCNDKKIDKANFLVNKEDKIIIKDNKLLKYVSRGGLKLEKALDYFNINVKNLIAMDIGSSTGGFCDCLIQNGIKKVIAIDVGRNLLHDSLKNNKLIELHEETNFKEIDSSYFKDIDIITCDVSFISIKAIIEKIFRENIKVEGIFLIKPQFECGKDLAYKYKGIILNKKVHIKIIKELFKYFNNLDFYIKDFTFSPISGGDGNIEYLVYLSNKISTNKKINIESIVQEGFRSK